VYEAALHLIGARSSRPLSIASAALGLFVPGSLIIFLARPALYVAFGINAVVMLSVAVSFPVLMIWYSIWYTPLSAFRRGFELMHGSKPLTGNLLDALNADDPLEWPCLLFGGWCTNLTLFIVAAIAYYRPIRIGATLLLVASGLLLVWLVVVVATTVTYMRFESQWMRRASEPTSVSPPS
jgi:hypothetical protein